MFTTPLFLKDCLQHPLFIKDYIYNTLVYKGLFLQHICL